MTVSIREAVCRNCADEFTYSAGGGKPRPLCQACETSHKWCPTCGYALVREGFGRDAKMRDGLEGCCKQCKSQQYLARLGSAVKRNPKANRLMHIKRRYGLSESAWDEMVLAQSGRCAICSAATPDLVIDHCHTSGAVRGLLCSPCNRGLGHFADDVDRMMSAVAYLMLEG